MHLSFILILHSKLDGESENPNSKESRENNSIMDAFGDFLVALKREIIILGILFANE